MREEGEGATAPFVLASESPRRSEILGILGVAHEVVPARVGEAVRPGESPGALVERLAREKAVVVAGERPEAWVLAGDTVVSVHGEPLGKPADPDGAVRMLLRLAGREHEVVSGLALARPAAPVGGARKPVGKGTRRTERPADRVASGVQVTRVRFRAFDEVTARAYVATGEPMGKAGAYAIQGRGAGLVEEIEGDFWCVVGLPVPLLVELLEGMGRPYRFGAPSSGTP